ncbi:tetratricopeptide-like protein [Pseudovirgaria hyperparasitica]|uniref:ER membrane protein complex subunit 2 n=1 Tax=Pseudovirgaria hyperparasitica TaxID=470096 RepID=A0A6A6W534_9PEZI|nr:tetratricopeptide-like protein [Pseudovirgaria hyperparasitica]KAF2757040.1 tetratricopeptide-like protein [Pseudovirgaria hyperparasitica]
MAFPDLLHPPSHTSQSSALRLSQEAPRILAKAPTSSLPYPLSLLSSSETEETWTIYENLFLSCLRTGDNVSARKCIDHLTARFGAVNERIMALTGIYKEAAAADTAALVKVLDKYNEAIQADPTNMPVRKRKVATLKALNRPADAIASLVELLDLSPTDAEAWSELSDLYLAQSMFSQAIYSLEEVLLIFPNAWAMQARMGELLYLSYLSSPADPSTLSEALRRYCRSLELCDDYLRGYYGLKITCQKILENAPKTSSKAVAASEDLPPPSPAKVEKLHELATKKLAEIVRRASQQEPGWDGYDEAELIAARALLDRDAEVIVR